MDRRTQIAVALIALILGANLVITGRYQKQRVAAFRGRSAQTGTPSAPATGPANAAAPSASNTPAPPTGSEPQAPAAPSASGPFALASDSDGDLVVETPLQRIRISRAGGVVRELALLQFDVYGSPNPVNLVPPEHAAAGRNALGLVLRGGGTDWNLSGARFDPTPGDFDAEGRLVLAKGSGPRSFELRCEAAGGGAIVERYTIDPDRYDFEIGLRLDRGPGLPRIDGYALEWTTGMPITESNPKEDVSRFRAVAAIDQQILRKHPGEFRRDHVASQAGTVRWACIKNKYFMVGLIPEAPQPGTLEVQGDASTHWIGMRLVQPNPWRTGVDAYRVYAGPIAFEQVRALGVGLESAVELGWSWVRPISGFLLRFMQLLNRFIPNYGIIIIIVSVLTRLVFWPLSEKSVRSMRRMQELQPRMEEIRRRYANDSKAMNEQIMLMYREQRVNPLGGCMPMLIQMPIFFALFAVLQSNIELRNSPFVAWIDNLAGPDILFRLPVALPFIGSNVSLLPLLMGATMLWQSALTPTPPTPAGSKPNAMAQQQVMMKWVMPIMMTFIFYKMPSGLVLYWIMSTLMGIAQQVKISRTLGPLPAVVTAAPRVEGRASHGRPDRGDGKERGGSPAERAGGAGRASR